MDHKELLKAADAYLDEHWEDIVADITKLVEIPSYEELEKAAPGAPYGPGPKAALEETRMRSSALRVSWLRLNFRFRKKS